MAITAAQVKELRDITGQSMMDCKNALIENDGNVEKAIELLRKKGMAVMEKRSERANNEGRIISKSKNDGKIAILSTLCCETDFTAKNDNFGAVAEKMANALLDSATTPADIDALAALPCEGRTIGDLVNDLVSQTGEKTTIGQFARYELTGPGLIYTYIHHNGKVATMIKINAENEAAATNPATKTMASDIALHITAMNPKGVNRNEISETEVEKEREIAKEQVKGKPANIIDNIVKGKIDKWFGEIILLEQPFVKDDKMTVQQLVDQTSKAAGGKLEVETFVRIQLG
ncbi:MAG: translation elongation factor Ts [Sedimentisphaerales bacterium]|nr:translation elongation factor Ts [Sedimentisphaerales bacterium]MBN2841562.1 translation elongation factor Ts [Sedimentisphaerales bacterium]